MRSTGLFTDRLLGPLRRIIREEIESYRPPRMKGGGIDARRFVRVREHASTSCLDEPVARVVRDREGRPLGLWFYGAPEPVYLFGDPE